MFKLIYQKLSFDPVIMRNYPEIFGIGLLIGFITAFNSTTLIKRRVKDNNDERKKKRKKKK